MARRAAPRRAWLLAAAWVVALALALAAAALPAQSALPCPPAATELNALGRDYRALRSQHGHFDGATRNPAVDDFGAAKHCLMDALRQVLQRERPSQRALRLTLGAPDHAWAADVPAPKPLPEGWQPQPGDRLQWYRWRGERDGLLVWLRQGRVRDSGWSLSHE